MKKFLNFFKNYKIRKEEKEKLERKRYLDKKKVVAIKLRKETELMLSKPCAINGFKKCSSECVHFARGFVYAQYFPGDEPSVVYISPRCRLWK